MQNSEKHYPNRREARNAHYDEEAESYADEIPTGGSTKALLIGLIAGIVGALVSVIITFLGSSLYQQAAMEANHTSATSTDFIVAGLNCLSFFVSLLVCFLAGFSTGKRAVLRKFGFFAGALAGAVMFLFSFLTRYIPNYPGNIVSQGATNVAAFSRGLIVSLVFLLIWFFIGGLIGLWGAGRATRKHPYYIQIQREEEAS
jgi:Mn2+/Fe2+ NRAMP family transporter